MEWSDHRWLLARSIATGEKLWQGLHGWKERNGGWLWRWEGGWRVLDESLEETEREREREGRRGLLSITQSGWKPRGRLCVMPLWNTSRNSSANRSKFWNFNSTARKSPGLFDAGSIGIVCCPRHVPMPGNDYLPAVWCFDEIWQSGNFRGWGGGGGAETNRRDGLIAGKYFVERFLLLFVLK